MGNMAQRKRRGTHRRGAEPCPSMPYMEGSPGCPASLAPCFHLWIPASLSAPVPTIFWQFFTSLHLRYFMSSGSHLELESLNHSFQRCSGFVSTFQLQASHAPLQLTALANHPTPCFSSDHILTRHSASRHSLHSSPVGLSVNARPFVRSPSYLLPLTTADSQRTTSTIRVISCRVCAVHSHQSPSIVRH